jgi:hypothetical protein
MFNQTIYDAVRIFAKNAFAFHAVDVAHPIVIAGLDTSKSVVAVHDVRFTINDRTTIKSRREQIARINITGCSDLRRVLRGWILVGRELRLLRHGHRDRIGER